MGKKIIVEVTAFYAEKEVYYRVGERGLKVISFDTNSTFSFYYENGDVVVAKPSCFSYVLRDES
jgi:hypothetical protein